MKYKIILGDRVLITDVKGEDRSLFIDLNGEKVFVKIEPLTQPGIYAVFINDKPYILALKETGKKYSVEVRGSHYEMEIMRGVGLENHLLKEKKRAEKIFSFKSPLSGLIVSLNVKPGTIVEEGDVLFVIESMKMRNEVKSPQKGIVKEIKVKEGTSVERGSDTLVIERIE